MANNCSSCGNDLYGSTECSRCGATPLPFLNLGPVEGAVQAQAAIAAQMTTALLAAQALPMTSFLEAWWKGLQDKQRDAFMQQFFVTMLDRFRKNEVPMDMAKRIEKCIESSMTTEVLGTYFARFLDSHPKDADEKIASAFELMVTEAYGKRMVSALSDYGVREAVEQGCKEVITKHVRERMAGEAEVLESAVRDAMPNIEEMTRRIVQDVSEDMAKTIRNRMSKDGS